MADKNWQAGGGIMIPAGVVLCLVVPALAVAFGPQNALRNYFSAAEPSVIWELAIGGFVVVCFLTSIGLWMLSTVRRVKRSQLRRNAFVSSALNNLKQGVVITDPRQRIVFLNDRYLEIYGLARSDLVPEMTGRGLLELRRERGTLDVSVDEFYEEAIKPEGLVTMLPNGRSVHAKLFALS